MMRFTKEKRLLSDRHFGLDDLPYDDSPVLEVKKIRPNIKVLCRVCGVGEKWKVRIGYVGEYTTIHLCSNCITTLNKEIQNKTKSA